MKRIQNSKLIEHTDAGAVAETDGQDERHGVVPEDKPALAPLLLTEEQAAALLCLSARKVWELAACGAIPSVKIGAIKRYRRIDLQEWVRLGCPTSQ